MERGPSLVEPPGLRATAHRPTPVALPGEAEQWGSRSQIPAPMSSPERPNASAPRLTQGIVVDAYAYSCRDYVAPLSPNAGMVPKCVGVPRACRRRASAAGFVVESICSALHGSKWADVSECMAAAVPHHTRSHDVEI